MQHEEGKENAAIDARLCIFLSLRVFILCLLDEPFKFAGLQILSWITHLHTFQGTQKRNKLLERFFKLPGSEFKFLDSVLIQPSVSVLSSKGLSLMPPPPITAPGSLQALLILTSRSPSPSASHSANLSAEMFPVYQALADKDMASLPNQSVLAMWGLPVCGQSPQKA